MLVGNLIFIVLILAGFFLLHLLSRKTQIPRNWLWLVWTAKLGYTLVYVYIFTTFYGEGDRIQGDALHFMEDGKVLRELASNDPATYLQIMAGFHGDHPDVLNGPLSSTHIWDYGDNGDWINDNRLIIRINSLIHFISFGNIYTHVLCFSMIAFAGLIFLYKAFEEFVMAKRLFFFAICLLPSLGFFGSGLTKETILIFSLGLLFWSAMKLLREKLKPSTFLLFCVAIALCFFNKPYAGLVIVPLLAVLFIGKSLHLKRWFLVVNSIFIVILAITLAYLPDKVNLVEKISYKQKDVMNLARGGVFFVTDSSFCDFDYRYFGNFDTLGNNKIKVKQETPGEYKLFGEKIFHPFTITPSDTLYEIYMIGKPSASYIEPTPINYQGINLVKTIPESLLNTLIRPFPTDPGSPLKYITIFQNWSILLFAAWVFFNRKKLSDFEYYWLYVLLTATLILLLVIGWTTPVFGAIVRYKIPVDICILISLFMFYNPTKKLVK